MSSAETWKYHHLDPDEVRRDAYEAMPRGGCMAAVTHSIVGKLAEQYGDPYASFPFHMMAYGSGGIPGAQSLCGAVNGAAAMIGLFCQNGALRRKMLQEFTLWCKEAALPVYVPEGESPLPSAVSGAVECEASLANWVVAVSKDGQRPRRGERCRRLTADIAGKTVELLNEHLL